MFVPLQIPPPPEVLRHLRDRVHEREITVEDLELLRLWVATGPRVPQAEPWFKRFPNFVLCGRGAVCTTILRAGQLPRGIEVF